MDTEKITAVLNADDALYKQTKREARRRLRWIRTGKVRHLNLFERATLSVAGRIDGSRSQPREDAEGNWASPRSVRKQTLGRNTAPASGGRR